MHQQGSPKKKRCQDLWDVLSRASALYACQDLGDFLFGSCIAVSQSLPQPKVKIETGA